MGGRGGGNTSNSESHRGVVDEIFKCGCVCHTPISQMPKNLATKMEFGLEGGVQLQPYLSLKVTTLLSITPSIFPVS